MLSSATGWLAGGGASLAATRTAGCDVVVAEGGGAVAGLSSAAGAVPVSASLSAMLLAALLALYRDAPVW
jgi:hypothetical protein